MVTFFKVVTKSDQFWDFDKKKNPASVVFQLLTGFFRTQTRDRTGMGCPTGVWDQRVYRFRHLGICFSQMRCKGTTFFDTNKTFWVFFEKSFYFSIYNLSISLKSSTFARRLLSTHGKWVVVDTSGLRVISKINLANWLIITRGGFPKSPNSVTDTREKHQKKWILT